MLTKYRGIVLPLVLFMMIIKSYSQVKPTSETTPQLSPAEIPVAYNNGIKINFIRTWNARKKQSELISAHLSDNTYYKQATQYFDGQGRPLQTVAKEIGFD